MNQSTLPLSLRTAGAVVVIAGLVFLPSAVSAQDKEPLKLELPAPTLKGTPEELPAGSNIEPLPEKPRAPFLIAKGVKNVALGKAVTSSVKPFTGELEQVTDGKKEAFDYDAIEIRRGTQWVQVDLGQPYAIQAIVIWHDHRYIQVMRDVIVQVSDDPEFKTGVTTLYNNDMDNSSELGVGTDREYFETHEGRIIEGKGVVGRYVRSHTRGSTLSALNNRQEIEVYALPAP